MSLPDSTAAPARAAAPVTLATERLLLRPWCEDDREPFAALNAEPAVMRYFPNVLDRAASDTSIDAWMQHFAAQGWSNWAVVRRDSGVFIGFVGLTVPRRVLPFTPCVEIGWRLAQAHWGQGFATEAARACLAFGFQTLGLAEIVSFTSLLNWPSRAVMERIGLRDTKQDFDHPALPEGHALRRHCLYRLERDAHGTSPRIEPAHSEPLQRAPRQGASLPGPSPQDPSPTPTSP